MLRRVDDAWRSLPPEALIEGPAPDGDLLLQRTLRAVRAESRQRWRRNVVAAGVAAVLLAGAGVTGGLTLGPSITGTPSTSVTQPSGTVTVAGSDRRTGSALNATITPAKGWVRVSAAVTGIPAGQKCRLIIVDANGAREPAGGWLVSPDGEANGTELQGFALVAPDNVVAIEVENVEGETFISVPV